MIKVIDKNIKKILLVTPDQLNPDSVASSLVLAQLLQKINKEVTILTNFRKYSEIFEVNFPRDGQNIVDSVQNKNYTAVLSSGKDVNDINIEKNEKEFKITINTKSGKFPIEQINFEREKVKFDMIILLGFSQLENSQEFRDTFGKSVEANETQLVHYYDSGVVTNSKYIVPSSSLSELVKMFSKQLNIPLTSEQATHLLTGIFFNTQNLKINSNRQTVKNLYLLVNKDKADIDTANRRIYKNLTKSHIYWFNSVFQNLKIKDNVCFSYIDDKNITSEIVGSLSNEDRIPIAKIKECDVAVVMVNLDENIHGFIQVSSNKYSALELTKDFYRLGDRNYVYFWTKLTSGGVLERLFKSLEIKPEELKTERKPIPKEEATLLPVVEDNFPKIDKEREGEITTPEEEIISTSKTSLKTQQVQEEEKEEIKEEQITDDDINYVAKMIEPKVETEEQQSVDSESKNINKQEETIPNAEQTPKASQAEGFVPSNFDPLPQISK